MMNRVNPLRWLAALLLLSVLSSGLASTALAQEEGVGAVPTPTAVVEGDVSIGGDSTTVISEEPTATDVPDSPPAQPGEATDEPSVDPTETPIPTDTPGGIGGDEGTGVSTGDGSPTPDGSATEIPTEEVSPTPSPTETVEAASVGVSVTIYTCTSAFDGGDPSCQCKLLTQPLA